MFSELETQYLTLSSSCENHQFRSITSLSVPEAATVEPGQGVMEDDTTKTQIKISWTNPSLLGGVNVTLGNFTQTIIDPNVSEFTFTESAPGTALVPGYSGVCEVKVLGIADCHMTGSAVLLISGCDTKRS